MKIVYLISFISIIILASCSSKKTSSATSLDSTAEEKFLLSVMPLIAQKAPYSNDSNRFESQFDEYYKRELYKFDLISYQKQADSSAYFLIYKIAPSLKVKKIAIGGRIKFENDSIVEFEEFFNTPKMEMEELASTSSELFDELVTTGNITKYIGKAELIEFPDARVSYDKQKMKWVLKSATETISQNQ